MLLPLGHDINTLDPTGMAWAALGGTGWACYIIFGKRVGHLPVSITAPLGAAMAALVVVPVGVVHAGTALLAPDVLLTSLGVALISSAIPISLELFALKHLPKNVFGTMTSMEPAVAALLALLLLGEVLSWSQCLAIGLIMLASMGCTLTAQSQTVKTKQPTPRCSRLKKHSCQGGRYQTGISSFAEASACSTGTVVCTASAMRASTAALCSLPS